MNELIDKNGLKIASKLILQDIVNIATEIKDKISICDELPISSEELKEKVYFNLNDRKIYKCVENSTHYIWKLLLEFDNNLICVDNYFNLPIYTENENGEGNIQDNTIIYCLNEYTEITNEDETEETIYKRGLYIFDKETKLWKEFLVENKIIQLGLSDINNVMEYLWLNQNEITNSDNYVSKNNIKTILKNNNNILFNKIDEKYKIATFDECNNLIKSLNDILLTE